MAAELRVTLRGDPGAMDVRQVLQGFSGMVSLLGAVEDVAVGRDRDGGRSTWAVSHLAIGSARLGVAPLEPLGDATWSTLEAVEAIVLDGFGVVEREAVLPDGWSVPAGKCAEQVAAGLGATVERGMRLALVVDGVEQRAVEVTHRAAENLRQALRGSSESIGSVTGFLESISVHGQNSAGVWLDHGRGNVPVRFTDEQLPMVQAALRKRVTARGLLRRDTTGRILRVTLRGLDIEEPAAQRVRLADLVGLDPNFTGDLSTAEYIEEMRGTS